MSLNQLTFFLKISTMLLAATLCFHGVASAQFTAQRLIPLSFPDGPKTLIEASQPITAIESITAKGFVVYGRAYVSRDAGIIENVTYQYILKSNLPEGTYSPNLDRLPDLELFFEFGGTLELVTRDRTRTKYDIVMSELMWGLDKGLKDAVASTSDDSAEDPPDDKEANLQLDSQRGQWIELYNTNTVGEITSDLYLLFTPFESHPNREKVFFFRKHDDEYDGKYDGEYKVLDAVSNLHYGKWKLPGRSGRRPTTAFRSAHRTIAYTVVEDEDESRDRASRLSGIPFGSFPNSWEETPELGRRNTLLRIVDGKRIVGLPYVGTPGAKHVEGVFFKQLVAIKSDKVVINEVRNDISRDNYDWIELKNVGTKGVELGNWELSIVSSDSKDTDLVNLPDYTLPRAEILLIVNRHPRDSFLADGINIKEPDFQELRNGAQHKYFVYEDLNMPSDQQFILILRSDDDKNGRDEAIEDYAGSAFASDAFDQSAQLPQFWARLAQKTPVDAADFGENSFAARNKSWARNKISYKEKDFAHHKDAWDIVGTQGGIGYDPNTDLSLSPGTPGYENIALKTQLKNENSPVPDAEYDDGEISISEIMSDPGPNHNGVQWIELYNSSETQAINLKGWELEIRNLQDEDGTYIEGSFAFEDAIILPNQTLLLVSEKAATDVPSNRIYDLYRKHRQELGLTRRSHLLLSPTAFYLKLTDTANPGRGADDIVVDEVGNLKVEGGTRSKVWDLPEVNPDRRRSVVRRYGGVFKPDADGLDGTRSSPDDGMRAEGWRLFSVNGLSLSFYGARDDLASPGSRLGGPLPVALSSFRPVRMETGEVLIRWRTESELDNAGFNILRSETRDGGFTVINLKGIIPGHGTSSEQHLYSYTDTTVRSGVIYYYRIEDVSFDGVRQTLATVRLKGEISAANKLTMTWSELKSQK